MKVSEYSGDVKEEGKMSRKTYRWFLKWNRTCCFVLLPKVILSLNANYNHSALYNT